MDRKESLMGGGANYYFVAWFCHQWSWNIAFVSDESQGMSYLQTVMNRVSLSVSVRYKLLRLWMIDRCVYNSSFDVWCVCCRSVGQPPGCLGRIEVV